MKEKVPEFLTKSEELLNKAGGRYFVGERVRLKKKTTTPVPTVVEAGWKFKREHGLFFSIKEFPISVFDCTTDAFFFEFQLTWADLAIVDRTLALSDRDDPIFVKFLGKFIPDQGERVGLLAKHPALKDHLDRVSGNPGLKKWLAERKASKDEEF